MLASPAVRTTYERTVVSGNGEAAEAVTVISIVSVFRADCAKLSVLNDSKMSEYVPTANYVASMMTVVNPVFSSNVTKERVAVETDCLRLMLNFVAILISE